MLICTDSLELFTKFFKKFKKVEPIAPTKRKLKSFTLWIQYIDSTTTSQTVLSIQEGLNVVKKLYPFDTLRTYQINPNS